MTKAFGDHCSYVSTVCTYLSLTNSTIAVIQEQNFWWHKRF